MAGLAAKLKATGGVQRGTRRPNPGDTLMANGKTSLDSSEGFVQTKGKRANQTYFVKRGKSGLPIRKYDDGSTALATGGAKGTAGARSPRPSVLRNQRQSDVADTASAAKLYKRFLDKQRPAGVRVGANGKQRKKVRLTGGTAAP